MLTEARSGRFGGESVSCSKTNLEGSFDPGLSYNCGQNRWDDRPFPLPNVEISVR